MRSVTVDGHSERWLRRGFPWVYPAELAGPGAASGEVVSVVARNGDALGTGVFDGGWVAIRVMRAEGGPLDDAWLTGVLERACALRAVVVGADTDAYRCVHGENDGLPGVRVDRWGSVASIVLDAPSLERFTKPIISWLSARGFTGVVRGFRPDHRDAGAKALAAAVVWGDVPEEVEVREHGLRYGVWPMDAPDCGLYCDLRETRAWLSSRWKGTRVLNLFAYTGAFTVSAAAGGASELTTVDLARPALDRARTNVERNGFDGDRFQWMADDVFRALDALRRSNRRFDRIVLDPPAFSRSESGTWSAQKDWPRLVSSATRVLADEGWIVVVSNQGELSPHEFHGLVVEGLGKVRRPGRLLFSGSQAPDFPAASGFPEGRYLKVAVWAVGAAPP